MGRYEYNFVEIPFDGNLKNGGETILEQCRHAIEVESAKGWRLVQVISPAAEKRLLTGNTAYEIIFERENG